MNSVVQSSSPGLDVVPCVAAPAAWPSPTPAFILQPLQDAGGLAGQTGQPAPNGIEHPVPGLAHGPSKVGVRQPDGLSSTPARAAAPARWRRRPTPESVPPRLQDTILSDLGLLSLRLVQIHTLHTWKDFPVKPYSLTICRLSYPIRLVIPVSDLHAGA
jgi:hypothetical protein